MATCASGHESADDDFCDVCGFAIGSMDARGTAPPTVARPVIPAPQAPRRRVGPNGVPSKSR